MSGVFKRAALVSTGVVLGMAIVAAVGALRHRPPKIDAYPTPPPPVHGERAPDPRA